ncbi:hypothetical protein, partial [Streptomyces sp. NPDC059271]|uniref:hypothetical protein n=1 Tax=Streptomyces sp. NPDC059271 TaxID=3346799 RepID=UPI00368D7711
AVTRLLVALRKARADEQVSALIARDPAAQADLNDPAAVAALLDALREAGADEQVSALIARDPAAQADLNDPLGAAKLLVALQQAGANQQVTTLIARLPAWGHFSLFTTATGATEVLRRGREPDGSAVEPWTWDELV